MPQLVWVRNKAIRHNKDNPSAFLHSDVRENVALWNEWSVQMDQAERFFAAQGQKNP